jgi:hypothetical protein
MNAFISDNGFRSATPERLDALTLQWAALREAASAIAMLAGEEVLAHAPEHLAFPRGLHSAPPRRRMMIEQALGDLVAMMEPGVAALLSVHERGGDAAPAARALWQEFVAARGGVIALVPPEAG